MTAFSPNRGVGYRVWPNQWLFLSIRTLIGFTSPNNLMTATAELEYDDGSSEFILFPNMDLTSPGAFTKVSNKQTKDYGYVVAFNVYITGAPNCPRGSVHVTCQIVGDQNGSITFQTIASGYHDNERPMTLGVVERYDDYALAFMDVTYTQANAAGGAVVCEIALAASGTDWYYYGIRALNSGTNTIQVTQESAVGGAGYLLLGAVGSGAATTMYLNSGGVATASPTTTAVPTGMGVPGRIGGVHALKIAQTAAGAQNDTFRVMALIGVRMVMPVVVHSNSTNPANVSVTAGAESFTVI